MSENIIKIVKFAVLLDLMLTKIASLYLDCLRIEVVGLGGERNRES